MDFMKKAIIFTLLFIGFFNISFAQEIKTIISPTGYDNINKLRFWNNEGILNRQKDYSLIDNTDNKNKGYYNANQLTSYSCAERQCPVNLNNLNIIISPVENNGINQYDIKKVIFPKNEKVINFGS